jgi:hypothetical protein
MGTGLWCFTAGTHQDLVEIIGTKGKITFSTFGNEPIIWETKKKKKNFKIKHPTHIQQPHIQSIIDQLNNTGTCPSNGRTAIRTTWVMDQILKDWRKLNSHVFDGQ